MNVGNCKWWQSMVARSCCPPLAIYAMSSSARRLNFPDGFFQPLLEEHYDIQRKNKGYNIKAAIECHPMGQMFWNMLGVRSPAQLVEFGHWGKLGTLSVRGVVRGAEGRWLSKVHGETGCPWYGSHIENHVMQPNKGSLFCNSNLIRGGFLRKQLLL